MVDNLIDIDSFIFYLEHAPDAIEGENGIDLYISKEQRDLIVDALLQYEPLEVVVI